MGHHRAAVRILAAAEGWRLFGPRTEAQQAEVYEAERQAREELGPQLYEAERAAGRALTLDDVIGLLTRITEELPEAGRVAVPESGEAPVHAEVPGFTSGLTPDRLTGN